MFWLIDHDAQGLRGRRSLGSGQARTKDDLSTVRAQKLDCFTAAGHESTGARQRFGETADDHLHAAGHPVMIHRAAPLATQHADAMSIVYHGNGTMFVRQLNNLGERRNVPFD